MNSHALRKFIVDWHIFKTLTNIPANNHAVELYMSCSQQLQSTIFSSCPEFSSITESELLDLINTLVARPRNRAATRMHLQNLIQQPGERIMDFKTRILQAASECDYTCPNCLIDLTDGVPTICPHTLCPHVIPVESAKCPHASRRVLQFAPIPFGEWPYDTIFFNIAFYINISSDLCLMDWLYINFVLYINLVWWTYNTIDIMIMFLFIILISLRRLTSNNFRYFWPYMTDTVDSVLKS